jgi:erythronate-4-phosphate dehydrogenase
LHPTIDLDQFKTYRIENAICTAFSPLESDKLLRETPEQFEYFRSHYPHPREFAAYTIAGGTIAERVMLGKLGFRMS